MKRPSIRRRLLAGVAVVQLLAVLVATALVIQHERRRSYQMLEAGLAEHAALIQSVIEPPEDAGDKAILHRELLSLPKKDVYVLVDARGQTIAASAEWRPEFSLGSIEKRFVDLRIDGRGYRALIENHIVMLDDNPREMARLPRLSLVYATPIEEVEEHIRRVTWSAVALGLAILASSLIAVLWLVNAGLRPVTRLAAQAARIDALHWEWEMEEGGEETEELAPLSLTLAHLVKRLRAAFVRERQFSADAAHEMKTAVAIVKSTLQVALEGPEDPAGYKNGLQRAFEDTERMQSIVNGMLQLAKIEGFAGPASDGLPHANVVEGIALGLHQLSPVLRARQIEVEVNAPDGTLCARIAEADLQVVLVNLLENAIHYSLNGSRIDIAAWKQVEDSIVSVRDTGCGIAEAALPHIFERFYRGDPSRSRESGGAGLGLSIIQAIVRRSGGSIQVQSTPGAGSVFTVKLPWCGATLQEGIHHGDSL